MGPITPEYLPQFWHTIFRSYLRGRSKRQRNRRINVNYNTECSTYLIRANVLETIGDIEKNI